MSAKTRRRSAARIELDVVESLGGRKTFLSGAGDDKADGTRSSDKYPLRIEVKSTTRAAFSLRAQDWADVVNAARPAGQHPMMVIDLRGDARLCVIRTALAHDLFSWQIRTPIPSQMCSSSSVSLKRWKAACTGCLGTPSIRLFLKTATWNDVCIMDHGDVVEAIELAEKR